MSLPGANVKPKMTDSIRGSFGLFTNAGNRQIAYLNTRFLQEDLQQIKTVRQVIPRHVLRIRELMQRDIDDDRVRSEVVQYLTPQEGVVRTRFFPPIVVAALPKPMPPNYDLPHLYPAPTNYTGGMFPIVRDENEGIDYEQRIFGDSFGFRIPLIGGSSSENGELFHGCEFIWNRDKLSLVAIDGQHRLLAIKSILGMLQEEDRARGYESCRLDAESMKTLGFSSIPVCIVSPWMLFESNSELTSGDEIAGVFRQIFVDVNKNAKTVSASRNILLDEQDLISIFTRNMVDSFEVESDLPDDKPVSEDSIALYQFEWDSPDGKEFQVNDLRAVSSVGLLNKIIRDLLLGKDRSEDSFRNWLKIEENDEDLSPAEKKLPGIDPVNIGSTKFSTWQRPILERRFAQTVQPCLTFVLRNLFPARTLIDRLEEKRLQLVSKHKSEEGNFRPRCSLDFLLGSRGDQAQIRDMCALEHPVGSFDPDICKATIQDIANDFLRREIDPAKSKLFSRIFFSRVGQAELFEFVMSTLWRNASDDASCMELCKTFVAAFNGAFEANEGNQMLFSSDQPWNSLSIANLSTAKYKQHHIAALLKIALCFLGEPHGMNDLFRDWSKTRDYLVDDGVKQIKQGLRHRLSLRLSNAAEVREISDDKKRREMLDKRVREDVDEIVDKLSDFVSNSTGRSLEA
ncbi:DNA sulfur modification protein DndB [Novipirellula caenicola]|uniref:DGQHR domain protein n=1 Tax=Novipirellula caenicola TaxID=1536901 RepID=A0ABP9VVI2_9BACT